MKLHVVGYRLSAVNAVNQDTTAATDGVLGVRNNHLVLTEPFNLLAAYLGGANITRARFGNVALTQKSFNHLWGVNRSATPPSVPTVDDRRDYPLPLPLNEEITLEISTDGPAMGNADVHGVLLLAKPDWDRNLPAIQERLTTRCTAVVAAGAAGAWTAEANITMERDLYNGVYAVLGANMVNVNGKAFRFRFPDQRAAEGKQLRPGFIVQNANGNQPWPAQQLQLGEWGRFHTFTLPTVQCFDDTVGGTYEIRFTLGYLGARRELLQG